LHLRRDRPEAQQRGRLVQTLRDTRRWIHDRTSRPTATTGDDAVRRPFRRLRLGEEFIGKASTFCAFMTTSASRPPRMVSLRLLLRRPPGARSLSGRRVLLHSPCSERAPANWRKYAIVERPRRPQRGVDGKVYRGIEGRDNRTAKALEPWPTKTHWSENDPKTGGNADGAADHRDAGRRRVGPTSRPTSSPITDGQIFTWSRTVLLRPAAGDTTSACR